MGQSHFKADIMNKSIFLAAVAMAVISICSAETPEERRRPWWRPTRCSSDADCTRGSYNKCITTNGRCVQCIEDSDCDGRLSRCAVYNKCVDVECIGDSDCTDKYCSLGGWGKCLPQLPMNATCITDAWCQSGTCTDNMCM